MRSRFWSRRKEGAGQFPLAKKASMSLLEFVTQPEQLIRLLVHKFLPLKLSYGIHSRLGRVCRRRCANW